MVPFLTHNRSLQILKLSNNGLGPSGGTIVAEALLASAKASTAEGKESKLRVVHCGRNRLENGSAPKFAEAFAAHGKLIDVRMPQNGIRQEGITALAEALVSCSTMEYLDLQDNCTSNDSAEEGWQALAKAISAWPHLHTLELSDSVLNNEGAAMLFDILAQGRHTKLTKLHLQNDNLDETILETISGVLEHLPALKTLELQWNEVDPDDPRVQVLQATFKRRGGVLRVEDEDEEEEDEEEREEKEEVIEEKAAAEPEEQGIDDLADAMSKLGIDKKQP